MKKLIYSFVLSISILGFSQTETSTKFAKHQPNKALINSNEPIFIVNGEEFSKKQVDNLSPNTIESMNILKPNEAIIYYGEKGKNGAIVISTKKNDHLLCEVSSSKTKQKLTYDLVILDSVEQSKEQIENLSHKLFEKIQILNAQEAIEKYGEKGKNGAIIITSKKEN